MGTEKDVRELVIVNELSQLLGKAFTIYNKTTGEAFGLDGQAVINIASAAVDKSQNIPLDSGSTTKVPVVAAVESELNKKVSLSGNEAVAGVKTFSSSPIVPSPTAAQQAASKKYVDDSVATRQAALTFGIADANAVKINAPDVVAGDFARFTALGLQGRSAAEVISDIGAESVANKNIAGGYAGLGLGGKVLPELLPDFVLGQVRYGGTFSAAGVIVSEYASLNGQNISSISATDYLGYYFIALDSITVHGYSFYEGDWLISNGSAGWGKIDNTDAIRTTLESWVADGVISPLEKLAIRQTRAQVLSEKELILLEALEYGLDTQNYITKWSAYDMALSKYSASLPLTITIEPDLENALNDYITAKKSLQNLKYIAEGAVYIGLDSSLGWMIGQGETTTITARVYKRWVEVSAQVLSWIWSRESGDAADDLIWDQAHANSNNVIEISFNDLGNAVQQNISCKFTIQAAYEDIILNESFTI